MIKISYFLFFLLLFSNFSQGQETMSPDFPQGFIPNQGQFSNRVGDTSLLFAKFTDAQGREISITTQGLRILASGDGSQEIQEQRICFSNRPLRRQQVFFEDPFPHHFNYFYPHCPQGIYGVKAYRKVRIGEVQKGVDLELSLSRSGIESRFIEKGATKITPIVSKVRQGGKLYYDTIKLPTSSAFSSYLNGYASPTVHSKQATSASITSAYGADSLPKWGTYWSGGKGEVLHRLPGALYQILFNSFSLNASTSDAEGNLYITGKDSRSVFPLTDQDSAYIVTDSTRIDIDAFIAKFDASGLLLWATYYGSSMCDEASVIALNSKKEIYVGGSIIQGSSLGWMRIGENVSQYHLPWQNDFPVHFQENAYNADTGTLFMLKFNENGQRVWASLYGPNQINSDSIFVRILPINIEIDSKDQIYISGMFLSVKTAETTTSLGQLLSYAYVSYGKKLNTFGPPNAYTYKPTVATWMQFLLKFNAQDSIRWSTLLPLEANILGVKTDSKQNLYLYGMINQMTAEAFPLVEKRDAYFYKCENIEDLDVPFLMQFDSVGILQWSTHLIATEESGQILHSYDLWISPEDHLIISGISNSTQVPIVPKENAYMQTHSQAYAQLEGKQQDSLWTFLTEFDAKGKMIWSTFYAYKDFQTLGYKLVPDLQGGFYLSGALAPANVDIKTTFTNRNTVFLSHFNAQRKLVQEMEIPCVMEPITNEYRNNLTLLRRFLDIGNIQMGLRAPHKINAHVSKFGHLTLTTNGYSLSPSLLKQITPESYFQTSPAGFVTPSDTTIIAGMILTYDLCDTSPLAGDFLKDSLYCAPLLTTLSIPDDRFIAHQFIWNAGTADEFEGRSYTVHTPGPYFVQAKNLIYTSCPTIYSDTIHIDTLPPPVLHFPQDTVKRCVGEGVYAIDVTNPQSTYLWSDGSTDSVYLLHYTDTPIVRLSCTVTNACGVQVSDTLTVEYLPPYAYLGEDTVLCKRDNLLLDMEKLNAEIPATLQYSWFLNGTQVEGVGPKQGQYLITSKDSGTLVVEVYWADADCRVARDTLEFSYYLYPDVVPHIEDTSICSASQALFNARIEGNGPDALARWYSPEQVLLSEADSIFLSEEGVYTLELQNYCSQASDDFSLSYYPLWWTDLVIPSDTFKCEDQPIVLDVRIKEHPTTYRWGEDSLVSSGVRSFDKAGDYEITLTDSAGCSQSHTIHLRSEECSPVLEIPNVFTPNNDGINDVLKVKTQEQIFDFKMQIFTSWGLKVYEYSGEADAWQWDGNTKGGKALPDGAYFWVALFKNYKGEKKKETGCVMILR